MSELSNIPSINQKELLTYYDFAINHGKNILIFGPSGAGKTDMAKQATRESGYDYIYWNMSTMDRPDIQGIPAISVDKLTSHFALNDGLPFQGIQLLKNERLLQTLIDSLDIYKNDIVFNEFYASVSSSLEDIRVQKIFQNLNSVSHLLEPEDVISFKERLSKVTLPQNKKIVLFLDEIDKAPQESLNPLLEMLLYHTINGHPLNIQAIILTGNLPDENAHSEPLSQALTNRAMIFQLVPDVKIWLEWGLENNLHEIIVAFLSHDENANELFNKRPTNNQLFHYAYPSARSWTDTSHTLKAWEKHCKDKGIVENQDHLKSLVASHVGEEAASRLFVWINFYRKHSELIQRIFDEQTLPLPQEPDEEIVCCIALAQKFTAYAKRAESLNISPDTVRQKANHIFTLICNNVDPDVRICAFRSAYDEKTFKKYELGKFPETRAIWQQIIEIIPK